MSIDDRRAGTECKISGLSELSLKSIHAEEMLLRLALFFCRLSARTPRILCLAGYVTVRGLNGN